jgi:phage tail tape-measure protein
VLYGDTFVLSGSVNRTGAGAVVIVLARPHGRANYSEVGRVRTTAGGRWRYVARPGIRTVYRAQIGRLRSTPVSVDVEPRIALRGNGASFTARVRAARSFAGKFVVLQERTSGPWRPLRRLVLDDRSETRFTSEVTATRRQLRLFMPRSQVGPGYVAARGPVITLRRR